MAALSHVAIVLFFMGAIVPIIIWVTQKEKSSYVAFQALQAAVLQITMILAYFVAMLCYFCSFFSFFLGAFLVTANETLGEMAFAGMFAIQMLLFGLMFVSWFAFIIYGIVGAMMTLQGKEFRYFIIANRLEKYLMRNVSSING